MANIRIGSLAAPLLASIVLTCSGSFAEDRPTRPLRPSIAQTPPASEIHQDEYLLTLWGAQDFARIETPSWATNLPAAEQSALKKAAAKFAVSKTEVASALIREAATLGADSESTAIAERLYLLAARQGVQSEQASSSARLTR